MCPSDRSLSDVPLRMASSLSSSTLSLSLLSLLLDTGSVGNNPSLTKGTIEDPVTIAALLRHNATSSSLLSSNSLLLLETGGVGNMNSSAS